MRSCTDNIARLESSLAPGQPGVQNLNPHGLAHRHGVVSPTVFRGAFSAFSIPQCQGRSYAVSGVRQGQFLCRR